MTAPLAHATHVGAMTVRFSSLLALLAFAFSGLGAEPAARLKVGGGEIEVSCDRPVTATLQKSITEWVTTCARAVTSYYGHFPVKKVRIEIAVTDSDEVSGGMTYGYDTPVINLNVGNKTKTSDLAQDWILTHEMVHLSFPSVADEHHWIEEGIATYVEPIARAQIHQLTPESIWADVMENAPGLPKRGDKGLDHTHTWGRTYWGGALFCLTADIEIRKQTGNRKGLEDALRAIVDSGKGISEAWPLRRALDIGDHATGTAVLSHLYDSWKATPVTIDLDQLWRQLGVSKRGDKVIFDDSAPLAPIRKAITAPGVAHQ